MKPSSKARLARLGPIQGTDRVHSGSPADLVLRPAGPLGRVRTIDAIEALVRRGVTATKAKRAIEAMVQHGEAVVHVPKLECARVVGNEFRGAGIEATRLKKIEQRVNVRALREHLGIPTAEAFAARYNLNVRTVEGWESGRPIDDVANTYLFTIQSNPDVIGRSLEESLD